MTGDLIFEQVSISQCSWLSPYEGIKQLGYKEIFIFFQTPMNVSMVDMGKKIDLVSKCCIVLWASSISCFDSRILNSFLGSLTMLELYVKTKIDSFWTRWCNPRVWLPPVLECQQCRSAVFEHQEHEKGKEPANQEHKVVKRCIKGPF